MKSNLGSRNFYSQTEDLLCFNLKLKNCSTDALLKIGDGKIIKQHINRKVLVFLYLKIIELLFDS